MLESHYIPSFEQKGFPLSDLCKSFKAAVDILKTSMEAENGSGWQANTISRWANNFQTLGFLSDVVRRTLTHAKKSNDSFFDIYADHKSRSITKAQHELRKRPDREGHFKSDRLAKVVTYLEETSRELTRDIALDNRLVKMLADDHSFLSSYCTTQVKRNSGKIEQFLKKKQNAQEQIGINGQYNLRGVVEELFIDLVIAGCVTEIGVEPEIDIAMSFRQLANQSESSLALISDKDRQRDPVKAIKIYGLAATCYQPDMSMTDFAKEIRPVFASSTPSFASSTPS